ncbi:hypothetical protein CBER1_02463 [Cercospora berteroae]|uniref:N-acetyltransferase domain-containing protein n=1 Tax=Cercospora berteroae TaxID=357750 RepID=A0A2S6CID6_9PEZI|nr:hypothetical protein CBER1_02463 [Cercospora berteroae]
MVGVSQLPMLYVLASKNLSPFRYISRASHEEVLPWHRVLGYTTYSLIGCHAVLYLNKYYQTGELMHAFSRLVPLLGIAGFFAMTLLTITTLGVVRRYSYRVFYGAHVFAIITTPVIVWFHVPHGRNFAVEALLILLAEMIARSASTVVSPASVTCITGTDLMKLVIEVPRETLEYHAQHPALHSYITLRDGSWRAQGWKYIFSWGPGLPWNPFTIAAVDVGTSEITLIVRRREGPLTRKLASIPQEARKTVVGIRGPYGSAAFFPDFKPARFDRILLVAGGVGITFIMPIFKHIRALNPSVEVELVWSVRDFNELACLTADELRGLQQADQHTRIYVTGSDTKARKLLHDDTEPADRFEPVSDSEEFQQVTSNLVCRFQRPDLPSLVDSVFESGAKYIITNCVVEDSDELTRNNISAFWSNTNWRLAWSHRTLESHISEMAKRAPHNLVSGREQKRHQKAVDSETGRIVGYIRWLLPPSHTRLADGTPAWPEAMVPAVREEKEAEFERLARTIIWDPQPGADALIAPVKQAEDAILAAKSYMRLDYLAVRPDRWGNGIGAALVRSGMEQASVLGLDIFVHAFAAGVKLYQRCGFHVEREFLQDDSEYGGDGKHYTALMVFEPAATRT